MKSVMVGLFVTLFLVGHVHASPGGHGGGGGTMTNPNQQDPWGDMFDEFDNLTPLQQALYKANLTPVEVAAYVELIEDVIGAERINSMHENGTLDNFVGLVVSSVNIYGGQAYRDLYGLKVLIFDVDASDP